MSFIYEHPKTYDLEHSGPQPDVEFLLAFTRNYRPVRILEYACGNGRLTSPMAEAAAEWGGTVTGIDSNQTMLDSAKSAPNPHGITWESGDVRAWKPLAPVDLIISFCGSLSHLLTIDDQTTTWRNAFDSLAPGGRFLIVESAPDYEIMADAASSAAGRPNTKLILKLYGSGIFTISWKRKKSRLDSLMTMMHTFISRTSYASCSP